MTSLVIVKNKFCEGHYKDFRRIFIQLKINEDFAINVDELNDFKREVVAGISQKYCSHLILKKCFKNLGALLFTDSNYNLTL